MLVRFLTAIALAATTAAILAGTDTAAQAPPVQQPAAARPHSRPSLRRNGRPTRHAEEAAPRAEGLPLFAGQDRSR